MYASLFLVFFDRHFLPWKNRAADLEAMVETFVKYVIYLQQTA